MNIRVRTSLMVLALAIGVQAQAQTNSNTTTIITQPKIQLPGDLLLQAGLKSYNDSGRMGELQTTDGRQFKSKNEYYLGAKNKNGWGAMIQAVETGLQFNDANKNRLGPSDPSLTIVHPIYKTDLLTVTGALREYFPVSDNSVTMHQYQQAYYLNTGYKMKYGWDLFNQLIPRHFVQDRYRAGDSKHAPDTTWYAEDLTFLTKRVNNWFRYGIGQHSQLEYHDGPPSGKALEIFPLADLMLNNSIFIGPRVLFPISVQNSVYDAPRGVGLDQVQAEVYMQATL